MEDLDAATLGMPCSVLVGRGVFCGFFGKVEGVCNSDVLRKDEISLGLAGEGPNGNFISPQDQKLTLVDSIRDFVLSLYCL